MLQAIVDSIFVSGVTGQVLLAVNLIFLSLLVVLLCLLLIFGFNIHLLFLLLLCGGLLASINWFVLELWNAKPTKENESKND
ncbi:predicted protein [Nematostella vectensis]|uniref:Uncharacterized protein n=1 Tax=Nematostella vectensis TaxID=45351 RepID=A7S8A7_NEMVE|nr:predicted protein [Nematostella vectensis]|eukprot:XP_001632134.1 predicted protein [Nematostella vectensis]